MNNNADLSAEFLLKLSGGAGARAGAGGGQD